LVIVVWDDTEERYIYQPGTDINKMTLSFLLEKLDTSGSMHKIVINNSDYRKIDAALSKFEAVIASSEGNILLRDL